MTTIADKPTRTKKQVLTDIAIYEEKLALLMAEDRTNYAQEIIDKIFTEFAEGGKWNKAMGKFVESMFYVYSPIGRKRNLPAALTEDRGIVAQQVRRGSNAPIQGMSSEVGTKASRRIMESYYKELPYLKKMLGIKKSVWDLKVYFDRIVHDASYFSVPYCMVIPYIHILQYEATYGITKAYKAEFNFALSVEPEIAIDVTCRDDKSYEWSWAIPNLIECITKALKDAEELEILPINQSVQEILEEIFKPWQNKELRDYLQSKYPLLNVPDLNKQISNAIKIVYNKKE
jgi:hypothetical protein